MIVRFSRHAVEKLGLLNSHGVKVRRKLVELALAEPERVVRGLGGDPLPKKGSTSSVFSESFLSKRKAR